MGINFFRKLRNKLTGQNVTTAGFDILQSKLDVIATSLVEVAASVKNLDKVAKHQPSAIVDIEFKTVG